MNIEDKKEFNHGSYGIIYDNFDGTLTKILRFDTTSPDAILKIKELNLDNFYKIFDVLILNNGKHDYLKAYKMEKILEEPINLNKVPMDFLITNIKVLINSMKLLSDNYIIVNDLHEDNLIINKDGIYVIDCDSYKYNREYDKELIYYSNVEYLKKAIYEHLYKDTNIFKRRKLSKLFKEFDLFTILNKIENSNSIHEYLKK